jgi:hypothetical protein
MDKSTDLVDIHTRRYTGDRRSPKPFGRITTDTRVILASFFDPICGDDHPCISRSVFAQTLTVPTRVLTLSSTPSVPVRDAGVHPPAAHDVRRAPATFVAEVDHVRWAACTFGSTWWEPDTLAGRSPPNSLITFPNWWSGAGSNRRPSAFQAHLHTDIRGVAACCQARPGRPAGCKTMAGGCPMWPDVCRHWLPVWLPPNR